MRIKKFKIWQIIAIPLLLVSCSGSDEGEDDQGSDNPANSIVFTSSIQANGSTDEEDKNKWQEVYDRRIAIKVNGTVKLYMVDKDGKLTSTEPFQWDGQEKIVISAWYPYNNGVRPDKVSVKANQSIAANYWASDYMEAVDVEITPEKPDIVFTHLTSRITCSLTIKGSIDTNKGVTRATESEETQYAQVTLHNLSGVETGNSVKTTANYKALLAPQTLTAGTEFVEITLQDGRSYRCPLEEDLILEAGDVYEIKLTLDSNELKAAVVNSNYWNGEDENMNGNSSNISPEGNKEGWTGSEENVNGSSSETKPGGSTSGWNGGNENVNGNSSETKPGGSTGGWNGGNENMNGSSSETKPTGGGTWQNAGNETTGFDSVTVGTGEQSNNNNNK